MNVKVIIKNQTTLELLEDAKKGDIINLNEVMNLDTSNIINLINLGKDAEYNKKFNEYKKELDKKSQEELAQKLKVIEEQKKLELEKVQQEIEHLKELQSIEIHKIKEEHNLNVKLIKEENNTKLQQEILKITKEKQDYIDNVIKENNELKNSLTVLNLQKSSIGSKLTGENLELYCQAEILSYMENGFYNCTFEKDNDVVRTENEQKGSKADFIFKIFLDETHTNEPLTSICLEMKDENPGSTKKTKDSAYFKKLDQNRNKKKCEYALLVSNLETDNEHKSPIYKVKEYPDMYVVRPAYLMTFLNMITSMTVKMKELIIYNRMKALELKARQDVLSEFNTLKDTYLNKPLERLNKQLEEILKQNVIISNASKVIDQTIEKMVSSYVEEITKKLDKFEVGLNKSYKQMEKETKDEKLN